MVTTTIDLEPRECPYREVCRCPKPDWKPEKGFKLITEGILCLDWDIVIPLELAKRLEKKEGRHFAGIDSADKIDAAWNKYSKSGKRKASQKKYQDSEAGQQVTEKYNRSERAKLTRQKYLFSETGQRTKQRIAGEKKLFREAARWLKDHPGKTIEDFMKLKEDSIG